MTKRRWVVLVTYLLASLCAPTISICFTPCSELVSQAYGVTLLAVSFCTLVFGLTSVPMFFISMKLLTAYSLANVLRLGCFFLVFGAWLRSVSLIDNDQFWPILTGTIIISLANPIFLCAQNVICNRWFADNERAMATAITSLAIPVGSIIAYI